MEAKQEANSKLLQLLQTLPKDKYGRAICPYCGSGSGKHHTSQLQYNANDFKPIGFCHKCRVRFDAIALYQFLHNASYKEAIEALSGQAYTAEPARKQEPAGAPQEPHKSTEGARRQNYRQEPQNAARSYQEALQEAHSAELEAKPGAEPPKAAKANYSEFFETAAKVLLDLPKGREGELYLVARKISRDSAELFNLGYSYRYKTIIIPAANGSYVSRAIAGEIPTEEAEHAQKIRYKVQGNLCFTASAGALSKDLLYIAEGTFDAAAIYQTIKDYAPNKLPYSGFIGLNSIACRDIFADHIEALEKKPLAAVLCLDSDSDGIEASAELAERLLDMGINVKETRLEGYKDPAEALQEGDYSAIYRALFDETTEEATTEAPAHHAGQETA